MNVSRLRDPVTALFRLVVGLLFGLHGVSSLFGVLGGAGGSGHTVEVAVWPYWYAAVIQLVGGLLVMIGLGTRTAALVCSGSMAYAYFVIHQPVALLPLNNGGELAALFCWSFLLIAVVGPGTWALDRLFTRHHSAPTAPGLAPNR